MTLLFSSDFETGIIDPKLLKASGNSPVLSRELARSGKWCSKAVLNRLTSNTSFRSEFVLAPIRLQPGVEYFYGFSIYLPEDYVSDPIWEIVAQWHSTPDSDAEGSLNPPLSLQTQNGEWRLYTIWDDAKITVKDEYDGAKQYDLGPYTTGKWTDWVFNIKWSPAADGVLRVFKDNVKVVDKAGPIGFKDDEAPYFKFGLYKGWKDRLLPAGKVGQRTVFHDEIRVATGPGAYSEVAPTTDYRPRPPLDVTLKAAS